MFFNRIAVPLMRGYAGVLLSVRMGELVHGTQYMFFYGVQIQRIYLCIYTNIYGLTLPINEPHMQRRGYPAYEVQFL